MFSSGLVLEGGGLRAAYESGVTSAFAARVLAASDVVMIGTDAQSIAPEYDENETHQILANAVIRSRLFFLEAHYIISYCPPDLQTVSGNTKQLENAHGYSILYNRKNVLYVPAG